MTTNTTTHTRRAMLGAIGIGTAAIAIGATAAAPTAAAVSPELLALFAARDQAEAACTAYERDHEAPIRKQWHAAKEAVPHYEFVGGPNVEGKPIVYTTSSPTIIAISKSLIKGPHVRSIDYIRDARRLVAAVKIRDRQIERLNHTTGIGAAVEECNRLNDLFAEALDAIADFPAATLADLHAKMQCLVAVEYFDVTGTAEKIAADIARIAAREA